MKILIDGVPTGKTHKCSTSYLMWEVVEELIKQRDDVFFYVLYPKASEDKPEEWSFLQRHTDRVKLFPYPYLQSDRLEEAFKLHEDLIYLLSPGDTPIWDYDVVLTSRISQLPFMRNMAGREANFAHGTHRLFVGIECMPIFSFRDTVAWASGGHNDLMSLAAYGSAGAIMIADLWTKNEVMRCARKWLTPSRVMDLAPAIHEVLPVKCQRLDTSQPKPLEDVLNVVFTGRMTGTRNFGEVAEMFRKLYSYPLNRGGKEMKFIVTTNSLSTGSGDMGDLSMLEIQYNNRTKFHELLKTRAHVVVNLSKIEDFSLSTYEPLLFGVPVIVPMQPWTDFLGKDYPFRVLDASSAYAVVKLFATDYAGQMEKFRAWEKTTWAKFVASPQNRSTLEGLVPLLEAHEKALVQKMQDMEGGLMYKEIVSAINASGESEVDALKFARSMPPPNGPFFITNSKVFKGIPIGKRANAYLLKVFLNMCGWRDTNIPGVLTR